jgi:membrane-associated phospholipid phosphatase
MTSDVFAESAVAIDAPRRALRLVVAYLAATAIPVVNNAIASGGSHGAITAAMHVSVLAACIAILSNRQPRSEWIAWVPLILWPALYAEVPAVIGGLGSSFHDVTVQAWESAIFGGQPARTLASAVPNAAISELLHAGYLSYYGLIFLPPALLFARGHRDEFARTVFAITAVWLVCLAAFAVFPVAGPRYGWEAPAPHGPVRSLVRWLLEAGSARGTAFPSSHVAVAMAQTIVALRFQRRVGIVAGIATVLLAVGAVYGGFHYAVDVIAGAVTGVLVVEVVPWRPVQLSS